MKNTPMQKENSINGQGAKDYWCRKEEFFIYIIQIYKLQGLTIQQYKNEKL